MYDFHTLSPLDFEEFTRDILQEEMAVRFESFGVGRDSGIDFRFARGSEYIIVQVKHYANAKTDAIVRAATKEKPKVISLAPKRYIFVTSASLTQNSKKKILIALAGVPLALEDIIGREDLNNLLRKHAHIERKHFKLWLTSAAVLERIVSSGTYNRTAMEMDYIQKMVPKFVANSSVPEAERILAEHGLLIVGGEPGVGKSTLARMLIWLHAEQGWKTYVVDDFKEAFEIAIPNEKRIIFFDDFLGQVQLTTEHIRSTDQRFSPFIQRIQDNKNLRLILTTRSYLWRQAQAASSRLASPTLNTKQFILNVGYFTREVKARILYNHLFFSGLSQNDISTLIDDEFYLKIIDHKNFIPRIIDLVTNPEYILVTGKPIRDAIVSALDDPSEVWSIPYRNHISSEGRTLMLSMLFSKNIVTLDQVELTFKRFVSIFVNNVNSATLNNLFRSAVKELEGSVIVIRDRSLSFVNPGVRDFLRQVVADDDLLETVLERVESVEELYFCDVEARSARVNKRPLNASDAHWSEAVRRVTLGSFAVLPCLELAISVYSTAQTTEIEQDIAQIVTYIEDDIIDVGSIEELSSLLDELSLTLLPSRLEEQVRDAVSKAAATIISDQGYSLNIDGIKDLSSKISYLQFEADGAIVAIKGLLEHYASTISDHLDEIHGTGELEEFKDEFLGLAAEYNVSTERAERRIRDKYDVLSRREDHESNEGRYSGRNVLTPGYFSQKQIAEMFSTLRSRD